MATLGSRRTLPVLFFAGLLAAGLHGQTGSPNGEWHYYGADPGSTKYSPLDQIDASNVSKLEIAWRWKSDNFGPRTDANWQVTPLMINGVLYFTAGTRRAVVAADAATGETLWMYRMDEGERGDLAPRTVNRGLAYWSDGKGDDRILFVTLGFRLVALSAKTGQPIAGFGEKGVVDLNLGLDRETVPPGAIGSSSPPMIIQDVVVVGAAHRSGTAPATKENVPGYIRGFDVRTGTKMWTFRTIPQPGEFGHETWENDAWKYTGNAGAWAPLSGDQELGYVYIPVEMPTSDFYGGHRPGDNLFGSSLVCLNVKTGKRVWHYQLVRHDVWDYDTASPPMLANVTVDGRPRKIVAQVTKQGFTYVFDRVTGEPIWPIVDTPVPQSTAPGEKTAATQPVPTKPAPFERIGMTVNDLIDFTPELKAQALEISKNFILGSMYAPPILRDSGGKIATIILPHHAGGANWPGGAMDPVTGIMYVASATRPDPMAVAPGTPDRTNLSHIGSLGAGGPRRARGGAPAAPSEFGPQGLPLVKPPWGRITAIDLNSGNHVFTISNGPAPDYVREHPALKGIDLSNAGKPERALLMVTKTLLFAGEGPGLFNAGPGGGGTAFRAIDKKTGKVIHEMQLPASGTGVPMTYMMNGRQYILIATGGRGISAELIALALP